MKHLKILLVTFLLAGCNAASAQDLLWAKAYRATAINSSVHGGSLKQDAAGNLYLFGYFNGTADFDPGPGVYSLSSSDGDTYILKLDLDGNFIWASQLGDGAGNINVYDWDVDGAGNMYLTGFFEGTVDFDPNTGVQNLSSPGSNDVFILKLDSSGAFSWVRQVGILFYSDAGRRITTDENGHVYVAGQFTHTVDFDPGPGTNDLTSNGNTDVFVLKLDASGNFVWAYSEGGAESDIPHSIDLDNAGNIYFSCEFGNTTVGIVKLDNTGNNTWTKTIALNEYSSHLSIHNSQLFLTARFTGTQDFDPGPGVQNLTSFGGPDIFLLKLDLSGNFIWVKQIGGPGTETGKTLLDPAGNIYLISSSDSVCDFDPGLQQYNLTPAQGNGESDLFIVKLDAGGNFISVMQLGNSKNEIFAGGLFDNQDNLVLAGAFKDTVDFDPGSGVYNLEASPLEGYGAFVLKLASTTGIPITNAGNTIAIYPNPSSGSFTVTSPASISKVIVTDVLGRLVYSAAPHSTQAVIELKAAPGMHYVTVSTEGGSTTEKIVVE